MERKVREIGITLERPFLTIQTIPFSGLPFLRITDKGLADIKNRRSSRCSSTEGLRFAQTRTRVALTHQRVCPRHRVDHLIK
jgi:hypothetical protein